MGSIIHININIYIANSYWLLVISYWILAIIYRPGPTAVAAAVALGGSSGFPRPGPHGGSVGPRRFGRPPPPGPLTGGPQGPSTGGDMAQVWRDPRPTRCRWGGAARTALNHRRRHRRGTRGRGGAGPRRFGRPPPPPGPTAAALAQGAWDGPPPGPSAILSSALLPPLINNNLSHNNE